MDSTEQARPSGTRRNRSSILLLSLIALPAFGLLVYLVVWAYLEQEWTWFALLLAATVGLIAVATSPHLFSLSDRRDGQGLCVEMPPPPGLPEKVVDRRSSTGVGANTAKKAPDRSA
jgi:hypothetical protein